MSEDYEQMYWQLRQTLNIHESHTHERCLDYVRVHNDRHRVAQEVISKARVFSSELDALERRTW